MKIFEWVVHFLKAIDREGVRETTNSRRKKFLTLRKRSFPATKTFMNRLRTEGTD